MSKNKEQAEQPAKETSSVELENLDIVKAIDDSVRLKEETAKEAAEAIAKQNKARRVDEMKTLLMKSDFLNQASLLRLRKARKEEKATKEFLKALTELNEALKAGKHDTTSWDKEFTTIRKTKEEAFKASATEHDEYYRKLMQNFCEWDTWGWNRILNN